MLLKSETMQLPIFAVLSTFVYLVGAWTIDEYGEIRDFKWPQDATDLPNFSSRQDVVFRNSYFEKFSKTIADQLSIVQKLSFYDGTVSQLYVKQNILELVMWGSKTENIEIDPDEEYAIVRLEVSECKLTRIPKNIKLLKRLEELSLRYNQIDHVQMSDFNELYNLDRLWLNRNGIKTLSSESTIHLPKLRLLDIDDNNLHEINVCSWDMPVLGELHLTENKLKFVVNLVEQFPKLKHVEIYNNPLVCSWKENLVRLLKSKNMPLEYEASCNATDDTPVPTECPTVCSPSNELSDVLQRLRSFEQSMGNLAGKMESFEQMMKKSNEENESLREPVATLTDLLQQMENVSDEDMQSLTDQLTQLRLSIDGLTEGFYRYVLKQEGGDK